MEIYLLRNGETVGPYSEAEVQGFLDRGEVGGADLAWVAGMEQWGELNQVLHPGKLKPEQIPVAHTEVAMRTPVPGTVFGKSEAGEAARKAVESQGQNSEESVVLGQPSRSLPLSSPLDVGSKTVGQPATEKQKAFLVFMGAQLPAELSMESAGDLINRVNSNPANRERMALWNVERLRLHPELFAEEIHAQKEERPAKYLAIVQKQGSAYFEKVTKAHCQVLLNHLDVQNPSWEQGPQAVNEHFFPALMEKFPKLVLPAGRKKFSNPQRTDGGRTSADRKNAGSAVLKGAAVKRDTPVRALVRGTIYGGVLLVLLHGGQMGWSALQTAGTRSASKPKAPAVAMNPEKVEAEAQVAAVAPPKQKREEKNDLGSLIAEATREAPMVAAAPKKEMAPEQAAPKKKQMPEMKPEAPMPEEKVAPPPPVKDPKSEVTLLKGMKVEFPFGPADIEAGTVLKLISKEGPLLKLRYGPDTVTVQVDQTDYADREAGKPPKTIAKSVKPEEPKPGAKGATPAPKPGGALF